MEDFVTYELAVKLKEKGFRKPCIATYDKDGMLGYNYVQPTSIRVVGFDECLVYSNDCVMAPTISQVLKWLRKEKKIFIAIFIDDDSDIPVTYEIYKGSECVCTHQGEYFMLKDWNKCELRAIEYALDNLIKIY